MTDPNPNPRRRTRATLGDVAARAGVSASTASTVLNQRPQAKHYSAVTRERIAQAARELGYRPNLFASQLRRADNRWIMLCVTTLRELFAAEAADAFEVRAAERGYVLVVAGLARKQAVADFQNDMLTSHAFSALAVVGQGTEALLPAATVAQWADEGTNCVLVNRDVDHPNVSRVLVDDEPGMTALAEHLYGQGVRRTALLAGPVDWPLGRRRREAMEACARRLGRPAPVVVHTPTTRDGDGLQAASELLRGAGRPEAFVCTTDYLAYGAIRACHEAGLAVGRDVAVTGFDDLPTSRHMIPALTTVRLPVEEMGRIAADLLIDAIEAKAAAGRVVLPTTAVVRESGGWKSP